LDFSIFRGGHGLSQTIGANVVAFGKFDGLHLGHRALLARSAGAAYRLGLPWGVATFERHPFSYLRPGCSPPVLTGLAQKLRLFREAGVQFVALFAADPTVLGVPAEDFARTVLKDRMATRIVVVGKNFQFGHGGGGGISTIRTLVAATGLDGVEVGTVEVAGLPVSASRVRARLAAGDINQVNELLGRPYEVPGRVDAADRVSASMLVPRWRAVPAPGSYSATIRSGYQRSGALLHGRVKVHGDGVGPHRVSVRWTEGEMRGSSALGPVLVTFDAQSQG
jgi:riboflavin kinase / FMN adenylyltransferase